jgi:predicted acylesterase/phospholipase RssA
MRTRYFSNCWGVFEGGGVRAAAFAGAYKAAHQAGISFSRVAGTSAGSLTAALIAAGATPEFIDRQLANKEFSTFLVPLEPAKTPFHTRHPVLERLRPFTLGYLWQGLTLALYGGRYSSRGIQDWIEVLLKELLAPTNPEVRSRPVRFCDLRIPLHVLAADILHSRPKTWSKDTTPLASVSLAVRCSCSIPFFFQAVESDADLCVDGGMLSNLPSFVFAKDLPQSTGKFSARILAFQLIESIPGGQQLEGIEELALAMANTVISGSTEIQRQLQSDVYTIEINTGTVKATDFKSLTAEQRQRLSQNGYDAVKRFVENERATLRASPSAMVFRGFDQKMLLYVQSLADCDNTFWISDVSSYWFYCIFPAVFGAIRRGVRIHFVTSTLSSEDRHETYRRRVLECLGVRVHVISRPPFNGFVKDPDTDRVLVAVSSEGGVVGDDHSYDKEDVRVYSAFNDSAVVRQLWNLLLPLAERRTEADAIPLSLRKCDEAELFRRLRKVPQYKKAKVRLEQVDIVDTIAVLQNHVKEYKYLQIDGFIDDLRSTGIELFVPQEIVFKDSTTSIVTPPVLETVGDRLVLIEGHTRLYYCLRNRISSIRAIIVDEAEGALPGRPKLLSEMSISAKTMKVDDQVPGLDKSLWRRIEETMHPIE